MSETHGTRGLCSLPDGHEGPCQSKPAGDRPLPARVPEHDDMALLVQTWKRTANNLEAERDALAQQLQQQRPPLYQMPDGRLNEPAAAILELAAQLKAEQEESDARQAYMEEVRAERDALAQQLQRERDARAQELDSLYDKINGYAKHLVEVRTERDTAREQLQQAQADRDRWALNYNMAQADLARARGSYEADVLRLMGERDEARAKLDGMCAQEELDR